MVSTTKRRVIEVVEASSYALSTAGIRSAPLACAQHYWYPLSTAGMRSARLHADCAVQTDGLPVQHRVLHDVDGEGCVLGRLAEPGREGDLLAEGHADRLGKRGHH